MSVKKLVNIYFTGLDLQPDSRVKVLRLFIMSTRPNLLLGQKCLSYNSQHFFPSDFHMKKSENRHL